LGERQSREGADVKIIFLHGGTLVARKDNRFEERLRKLVASGVRLYFRKEDLEARAIDNESMNHIGSPINTLELMKLAAQSDTLVSVI
jgi:sulfur relay protein TusB/DsrH